MEQTNTVNVPKHITNQNVPKQVTNIKSKKPFCNQRGPGKKILQNVPIFFINCAGCNNKIESLVDNVKHLGAGIFTIQETHFKRKGKINTQFPDFEIFESI